MRLLNKNTLELEWFLDENLPPYSILSHRWRESETSLRDFEAERYDPNKWSQGTAKVVRFCKEADDRYGKYVWVDTCCIDKTSSAELQEAINSMYRWYEQASICYVLLEDVDLEAGAIGTALEKSAWFTRGWTLQELIAPRNQVFVDVNWKTIETREKLSTILESITGIRSMYFGNPALLKTATIAERMSWLSQRQTSRTEDLAYCMLGIFDVNMVMLYGEGNKAFIRLQREIIQNSIDETLYLWLPTDESETDESSILAPHPRNFSHCRSVAIERNYFLERAPCTLTARGLGFEAHGARYEQHHADRLTLPLNCMFDGKRASIRIRRDKVVHGIVNSWSRVATTSVETLKEGSYFTQQTESAALKWRDFQAMHISTTTFYIR